MSSDDHILFDKCIDAFRPERTPLSRISDRKSHAYLLTSFHITSTWSFSNFEILPSQKVHLPRSNAAFVCRVTPPIWCEEYNSYLFGTALSAIVTFVTGRICKSPRDEFQHRGDELSEDDLDLLALQLPIRTAGSGHVSTHLSAPTLEEYHHLLDTTIKKLNEIPYKYYVIIMQAIRLIHLSKLNKKDDFGLAYFLIISAIETIAVHAIREKPYKAKTPEEINWKERATKDPDIKAILDAYNSLKIKDKFLKQRYTDFIDTYAPSECWEKIIPHPLQDFVESTRSFGYDYHLSDILPSDWPDIHPRNLAKIDIKNLIADTYTHRSCFVHRGQQPPHKHTTSSNHFFLQHTTYNNNTSTEKLLLKYELLSGIARHSILSWMDSIAPATSTIKN